METPTEKHLLLQNKQEVELLLDGLDAVGKNALSDHLRRRLQTALRYFKSQETGYEALQAAADKRNAQRRRDGRG